MEEKTPVNIQDNWPDLWRNDKYLNLKTTKKEKKIWVFLKTLTAVNNDKKKKSKSESKTEKKIEPNNVKRKPPG